MKKNDWMLKVLVVAGIYNLAWGAWVVLFPNSLFNALEMPIPSYIEIWQCVGMIVGVYGIGYLIAAAKPMVHWPIVLVGFLGKIFGPIGFAQSLYLGKLPLKFGVTLITNDFIWWIPFFLILKATWDNYQKQFESRDLDFQKVFPESLLKLSEGKKLFIVFLRHCGCTFTRETLSKIEQNSSELNSQEQLVIVHMGDKQLTKEWSHFYQINNAIWIEDPERKLYEASGLGRGSIAQVFNLKVFKSAVKGFFNGYGVGPQDNDGFQMPGVFSLSNRELKFEHQYSDVADTPNFHHLFNHHNA